LGKLGPELGEPLVVLALHHGGAGLEGAAEVVVAVIVMVPAARVTVVASAASVMPVLARLLGLGEARLEVLDLLVLALVKLALLALVVDAVVEVEARDEGAGDGGDEGGQHEALLLLGCVVSSWYC